MAFQYTYEVIGYVTITANSHSEANELFDIKLGEIIGVNDLDCLTCTITDAPPFDN